MVYNIMLISALQQSDSVMRIYIVFHILFHYSLLEDVECSPLYYIVGPGGLPIPYI